jgi:hypothetical protein
LPSALGGGLARSDRRALVQIGKNVAAKDYRFSGLVLEIVNSQAFQMRRAEPKPAEPAAPADTRTASTHPPVGAGARASATTARSQEPGR